MQAIPQLPTQPSRPVSQSETRQALRDDDPEFKKVVDEKDPKESPESFESVLVASAATVPRDAQVDPGITATPTVPKESEVSVDSLAGSVGEISESSATSVFAKKELGTMAEVTVAPPTASPATPAQSLDNDSSLITKKVFSPLKMSDEVFAADPRAGQMPTETISEQRELAFSPVTQELATATATDTAASTVPHAFEAPGIAAAKQIAPVKSQGVQTEVSSELETAPVAESEASEMIASVKDGDGQLDSGNGDQLFQESNDGLDIDTGEPSGEAAIDADSSSRSVDSDGPDLPLARESFASVTTQRMNTAESSVRSSHGIAVSESVTSAVLTATARGESRVELRLDPPELGTVRVELVSTDHGLTAKIVADTDSTSHLLQENVASLKRALSDAGVTVNDFSFGAGTNENQQDQSLQHQARSEINDWYRDEPDQSATIANSTPMTAPRPTTGIDLVA